MGSVFELLNENMRLLPLARPSVFPHQPENFPFASAAQLDENVPHSGLGQKRLPAWDGRGGQPWTPPHTTYFWWVGEGQGCEPPSPLPRSIPPLASPSFPRCTPCAAIQSPPKAALRAWLSRTTVSMSMP